MRAYGFALDPAQAPALASHCGASAQPPRARGAGPGGGGRSNAAIAQWLFVTERAVAKHTASIFLKLGLQPSDDNNRCVPAVLACLGR